MICNQPNNSSVIIQKNAIGKKQGCSRKRGHVNITKENSSGLVICFVLIYSIALIPTVQRGRSTATGQPHAVVEVQLIKEA